MDTTNENAGPTTGPMKELVSLPNMEYTARGYEVSGPDMDGEIELCKVIDNGDDSTSMWLTREDINMLVRRFDAS